MDSRHEHLSCARAIDLQRLCNKEKADYKFKVKTSSYLLVFGVVLTLFGFSGKKAEENLSLKTIS